MLDQTEETPGIALFTLLHKDLMLPQSQMKCSKMRTPKSRVGCPIRFTRLHIGQE